MSNTHWLVSILKNPDPVTADVTWQSFPLTLDIKKMSQNQPMTTSLSGDRVARGHACWTDATCPTKNGGKPKLTSCWGGE